MKLKRRQGEGSANTRMRAGLVQEQSSLLVQLAFATWSIGFTSTGAIIKRKGPRLQLATLLLEVTRSYNFSILCC